MNIDELLAPIPGPAPCGEDLSFSPEFDAISEMRREDDPTLDQGEWVTALKTADWAAVQAQCSALLVHRSKDLRLAMWWAEAASLTQGYAGMEQGIALCARLCERYWEELHPKPEAGDMEQRVGNIAWFLKRLVSLSVAAPVTHARSGAYSLQQMHAVRTQQAALDQAPDKAAAMPGSALTFDKFNRALRETPRDALLRNLTSLQACQDALTAWQAVVDTRLGADGPSFVPAREALSAALHEAQRLAREAGALPADALLASGSTAPVRSAAAPESARVLPAGPLRSREQALAQLREVAAFFRATEPHSPVAYLADKAVRWGDMPLHVWLRTVVKDSGSLAHLEELLGLDVASGDGQAG